jgi:hypothetical protein
LLETIELRRETQSRLDKLREDNTFLQIQQEQLYKFRNKKEVRHNLKKALDAFDASSSLRKKQIIQSLVPKLILDEQSNRLHVFINPFLENSDYFLQKIEEKFVSFWPKSSKNTHLGALAQLPETPKEILSQSEKKVCIATEWRGNRALPELFSSNRFV